MQAEQQCSNVAAQCYSVPYFSAICRQAGSVTPMPEVFVAKVAQFPDGERRIVSHAGCEIGVFQGLSAIFRGAMR
jgi:hypothetical protein